MLWPIGPQPPLSRESHGRESHAWKTWKISTTGRLRNRASGRSGWGRLSVGGLGRWGDASAALWGYGAVAHDHTCLTIRSARMPGMNGGWGDSGYVVDESKHGTSQDRAMAIHVVRIVPAACLSTSSEPRRCSSVV